MSRGEFSRREREPAKHHGGCINEELLNPWLQFTKPRSMAFYNKFTILQRCPVLSNCCRLRESQIVFSRRKSNVNIKLPLAALHQQQTHDSRQLLVNGVNIRNNCTEYVPKRNFSVDPTSWALWMSKSQPVLTCQSCLEYIHSTLDVPWWAVIVLSTVALRMLITFPVTVYQHIMIARLQNLQPEIQQIAKDLKQETVIAAKMYKWPEKHTRYMYNRSLKKQITKLIIRDNCHPFKSTIVVLIQLPIWISVSFALRNMVNMMPNQDINAHVLFLELTVGGALWFPNLTIPDQSFILPVALGLLNWAIIEIHAFRKVKVTRFQKTVTNFLRFMSLLMIPIAASVPSCMSLYWTLSSLIGLSQNIALQMPKLRRICQIPITEKESKNPMKEIVSNIKEKFKL